MNVEWPQIWTHKHSIISTISGASRVIVCVDLARCIPTNLGYKSKFQFIREGTHLGSRNVTNTEIHIHS